jgi:hypothetical protein
VSDRRLRATWRICHSTFGVAIGEVLGGSRRDDAVRIKAGWWIGLWVALSVGLLLVAGLGYSLFSEGQQAGVPERSASSGGGVSAESTAPSSTAAAPSVPQTTPSPAPPDQSTAAPSAALNGRGARSPAARAATCTADHGAINTTVLDGRDAVSIPGHATDDAAEPSNTAWPDCWRAVSGGARALNFAVRAGPGSDGRGPISPVTAADAR